MIREEADQVLNDLGLPHKKDSMASALSGGMQRKLSIAVAFIGGAKYDLTPINYLHVL
jgi:ABC-type multidrug transport system ATPase subunit